MAKSKKRGAKQRATPKVTGERLEALRANLDELEPSDLDDAEFEALVASVTRDEAETARSSVRRLRDLAGDNKRRSKSLRRGVHRLRQLGIATDDLALEGRRGIQVKPDRGVGGGLAVLLAAPQINGERRFTFALSRGPGVVLVEAVFRARDLFRLLGSPSNRVAYRRWSRQMCAAPAGGLPERVAMPPSWLARKLWEIGRSEERGELGKEVDRGLLEHLEKPTSRPPHPATDLALSEASVLSVDRLAERPERLHAFYHGSALAALRTQWYELGGSAEIEAGSEADLGRREDMKRPVTEWAEQWGSDHIVELLLDSALFFDALGDRDAALTFREVGLRREGEQSTAHDNRVRHFLLDVAIWQLSQ